MKKLNDKEQKIINVMRSRGFIPHTSFDVTDVLVDAYVDLYKETFGKKAGFCPSNSEIRYYRKLAALTLFKINTTDEIIISKRSATVKSHSGFVYIVSNEAYPNCFKIGYTKNMKQRLSVYQTADPYRKFKVENYFFYEDARIIEYEILSKFKLNITAGEWVNLENKNKVVDFIINRIIL